MPKGDKSSTRTRFLRASARPKLCNNWIRI